MMSKEGDGFFVHASSIVEEGASIGAGTRIWHFCHVREGATIGKNCSIGQNVYVGKNVKIGDAVKIQNNVSVYEGVILEDFVFCGPSVVFTNVRAPRSAFPKDPAREFMPTVVKKGATLGANSTIVCGLTIGRCSFVGAGSVITRDVPDRALVYGNPARIRGWVCECGARLGVVAGKSACVSCGRVYSVKIGGRVSK